LYEQGASMNSASVSLNCVKYRDNEFCHTKFPAQ